jgi:hypothetical protein
MATRVCEACGKTFEYEPPVGYPDKRKYCDECSAKRKAEWEAKKSGKVAQDVPKPQNQAVSKHDVVIQRTEKPHSYEFGKPSARHKIYYETVEELKAHIENLREAGFIAEFETVKID